MGRPKLDQVDKKILANLQENGRMTNVELAERVGITAPPCLRRVRALEEAGYIQGYHADLNAEKLGYGISVYAMVGLEGQSDTELKAFQKLVEGWPLVRECHLLNGEYDFLLKIVASDLAEFQDFLTNKITAADNVDHVRTSLCIRKIKNAPGVPLDLS